MVCEKLIRQKMWKKVQNFLTTIGSPHKRKLLHKSMAHLTWQIFEHRVKKQLQAMKHVTLLSEKCQKICCLKNVVQKVLNLGLNIPL